MHRERVVGNRGQIDDFKNSFAQNIGVNCLQMLLFMIKMDYSVGFSRKLASPVLSHSSLLQLFLN
jgi:hypothetical protein